MPKVKTFKCAECRKVYKTEKGFQNHLASAHPKPLLSEESTADLANEPEAPAQEPPVGNTPSKPFTFPKLNLVKFISSGWLRWVAVVVVVFVAWRAVSEGCNKKAIGKNNEVISDSTAVVQRREINLDSMLRELKQSVADSVLAEKEKDADERLIKTQEAGKKIRQQQTIVYAEVEKKVKDSTLTHAQRIALARHVLRTGAEAAAIRRAHDSGAGKTIRQPDAEVRSRN